MDVFFRPKAEEDLTNLYRYIAKESGSLDIAFDYVWRLREACLTLREFAERGVPRNDIAKGLRILTFGGRSVIAYFIVKLRVEIAAIFHGGQDWQTIMRDS